MKSWPQVKGFSSYLSPQSMFVKVVPITDKKWALKACLNIREISFWKQQKTEKLKSWDKISTDLSLVNQCNMSFQVTLNRKVEVAFFLHEQMQFVFSWFSFEDSCSTKWHIWTASFLHEQMQHEFSWYSLKASVVTNVTFEWLFSFMNWWNMIFNVTLLRTSVMSHLNFTFMNWRNMRFQVALLRTSVVTNVTFEWLFSSMN